MASIRHYRELHVYQSAMKWTMQVFQRTRSFPSEEKFALTDQIRRSSRSVCANLAEAWRKRRYRAAFIFKLNDAETEAAERQVHAEIAHRCGYLSSAQFAELDDAYDHIIGQIVRMADQPEKWLIRSHGDDAANRRDGETATSAVSPPRPRAESPSRRFADSPSFPLPS